MRHGSVEVHRRGGNGDELIVDIAIKAPDGSTCVDIRALRYAAVESVLHSRLLATATRARWRTSIEWQPWAEHADAQQPPDALRTLAVLGEEQCRPHSARSARRSRLHAGRPRRGTVCPLPSRARSGGRR